MLRTALRERFEFRCGFCGVHEDDVGSLLTVDHFQPKSQGGADDIENLVYCCHACNEYKADLWNPTGEHRILHPLLDSLPEHLEESEEGVLTAHTETGRFYIARLRLNRPQLIASRTKRRRERDLEIRYRELQDRYRQTLSNLDALALQIRRHGRFEE